MVSSLKKKKLLKLNNSFDKLVKNRFYQGFKKNKLLVFLIKFFTIFFVLSFIIEKLDLTFFLNIITSISANCLGLEFLGNKIFIERAVFIVTNSCTGLVSASILAAVIFALKKPKMHQKLKLFVFGTLLLVVINIPRIILILFVASIGVMDPDLIHTITWFLMSFMILGVWYFGTKYVSKIKEFNELL
jgi:exosortase/archaeosortase family protein